MSRFPVSVCAVCRRQDDGIGVYAGKGRNAPIAWFCEDASCRSLLTKVAGMPGRDFNTYEASSLAAAGDKAGGYLQRLGKTDLAELSREEWLCFLRIILDTYGDEMRARLAP